MDRACGGVGIFIQVVGCSIKCILFLVKFLRHYYLDCNRFCSNLPSSICIISKEHCWFFSFLIEYRWNLAKRNRICCNRNICACKKFCLHQYLVWNVRHQIGNGSRYGPPNSISPRTPLRPARPKWPWASTPKSNNWCTVCTAYMAVGLTRVATLKALPGLEVKCSSWHGSKSLILTGMWNIGVCS